MVVIACVGSADEELATLELEEDRCVSTVVGACELDEGCELDEECSVVVIVCVGPVSEELA